MHGAVSGGVKWLLRTEGLLALVASLATYSQFGAGWATFAWCFFAPDLAFLAYLAGPRAGAVAYNATHSYVGALLVIVLGAWLSSSHAISAGLIWSAHIGFDRMLGYGLKYSAGFGYTHLGRIGQAKHEF